MRSRLGFGGAGCCAAAETTAAAAVEAAAASTSDRVMWRMLMHASSRGAKRKASAYGNVMAALETGVIVVDWTVTVMISSSAR